MDLIKTIRDSPTRAEPIDDIFEAEDGGFDFDPSPSTNHFFQEFSRKAFSSRRLQQHKTAAHKIIKNLTEQGTTGAKQPTELEQKI